MPESYQVVSRSNADIEFQGLQHIFNTSGDIVESAVVGDKYYDPNTGKITSLVGQTEYENLTVTGVLSKPHFIKLRALFDSPQAKDGSLTATHRIGEVITILTGVRFLRLQYGSFDRTSNSPAEVTLEISFNGIRTS
jgi:hypothetical protein